MRRADSFVVICLVLASFVAIMYAPAMIVILLTALVRDRRVVK